MNNHVDLSTSLREEEFRTLYEAEYFSKRVLDDYPSRGYNTSCKITQLEGSWVVQVNRWNSCS